MSESKSKSPGNDPTASVQPEGERPAEVSASDSGQAEDMREARPAEEERQRLIAVAAYYRAEHRGFAPGCEMDDWLEAEAEIQQGRGSQSG